MTSERLKDWKRYKEDMARIEALMPHVLWDRVGFLDVKPPMARPVHEVYNMADHSITVLWSDEVSETIDSWNLLPDRPEPPVPAPVADTEKPKRLRRPFHSDSFMTGIAVATAYWVILWMIWP